MRRPAAQPHARQPAPGPAATQNGLAPRRLLLTDFDKTLTDCDAGAILTHCRCELVVFARLHVKAPASELRQMDLDDFLTKVTPQMDVGEKCRVQQRLSDAVTLDAHGVADQRR